MNYYLMFFTFNFILLVSFGQVWASVKDCTKINEDMDRLTCYDRESGYSPIIKTVRGKGDWTVQTQTSEIDDSTNVYLRLDSYEQSNCKYDTGSHTLYIACRENKTSLWVTFGGCFMADNGGKGRVTYRIDSERAQNKYFRESNDNSALGLWSGGTSIPFIKKLIGHSSLLLRATPFSDSTVTGKYKIGGLDEAIKPLRAACGW